MIHNGGGDDTVVRWLVKRRRKILKVVVSMLTSDWTAQVAQEGELVQVIKQGKLLPPSTHHSTDFAINPICRNAHDPSFGITEE